MSTQHGVTTKDKSGHARVGPSDRLLISAALVGLGLLIIAIAVWWQATHRTEKSDAHVAEIARRLEQSGRAEIPGVEPMLRRLEPSWRPPLPSGESPSPGGPATAGAPASAPEPTTGSPPGGGGAPAARTGVLPEVRPRVEQAGTATPEQPSGGMVSGALPESAAPRSGVSESGVSKSGASEPGMPESGRSQSGVSKLAGERGTAQRTAAAPSAGSGEPEAPAAAPAGAGSTAGQSTESRPEPAEVASAGATEAPLVPEKPRWMIQLIGYHQMDSVRAFVAENDLEGNAWTRVGRFRGRPWYTVLTGDYPDRDAAVAAINALPPALRRLSPIARRVEPGEALQPIEQPL